MRKIDLVFRAKNSVAQKLPAALEQKMIAFLRAVREARVGYDHPKKLIRNMDETPTYILICQATQPLRRDKNYLSPDYWCRETSPRCGTSSYCRWADAPTDGNFQGEVKPKEHHCS